MKYDEFISVIASDVGRILEENTANIAKDLLANIPQDQPCISPEHLQIIRNAVNTSIQFSVQIIFDYLDSLGMLEYDHLTEHHVPPVLRVIQGGLADENKK